MMLQIRPVGVVHFHPEYLVHFTPIRVVHIAPESLVHYSPVEVVHYTPVCSICEHCQYPEHPVCLYSCILTIAAIEKRT
jgi:hypothetical protein